MPMNFSNKSLSVEFSIYIFLLCLNVSTKSFPRSKFSEQINQFTLFQITATDLDSDKNGEISYSVIRGDNQNQFEIDEKTGYVSVAGELDRESVSSYVLEILAKDNGLPVLSRQTLLNVEISDANDNPPLFSQSNYTAIIQVIIC